MKLMAELVQACGVLRDYTIKPFMFFTVGKNSLAFSISGLALIASRLTTKIYIY